MSSRRKRRGSILVVALMALALCAGPALAEPAGRCYTAQVPESVLLPDGSLISPGTLRICMNREFTPGMGMLAAYSNGEAMGNFIGRVGSAAGSDEIDGPFFLFTRSDNGTLALQGYAVGDGDRISTYSMSRDSNPWEEFKVRTRWKLLADNARSALVVIAAS